MILVMWCFGDDDDYIHKELVADNDVIDVGNVCDCDSDNYVNFTGPF